MVFRVLSAIVLLAFQLFALTNFPFPQSKVAFGIRATNASVDTMESVFLSWQSQYYEENGDLARIKWDNPAQTVSEGIGYAMLIMVTMDNARNNTRPKFDKLWNYYKKWLDKNGLMDWKINGFTSVAGNNGATDADLDAATALVLAYRQWSDTIYRTDAKTLITAIWDHEVNATKYLQPGEGDWDKNPSYFSTGGMELFRSIDGHGWDTVIRNSYLLIKKTADPTTGLVPDWCAQDASTNHGGFGYDAVRVPWRMAWGYSWYGHTDAADIDSKIIGWLRQKTGDHPDSIKAGYTLAGSTQVNYSNTTYTGCMSCAGLVSASNQTWVDSAFAVTARTNSGSYYHKILQVLTMLLMSGNFTPMEPPSGCKKLSSFVPYSPGERPVFFPLTSLAGRYVSLSGRKIIAPKIGPQPLIRGIVERE